MCLKTIPVPVIMGALGTIKKGTNKHINNITDSHDPLMQSMEDK